VKRRTLTIVLAVVLAVAGTVAILAYVHQANNRAVAGLKAERVLAAKAYIASGTSLRDAQTEGLLKTERLPIASVPANAVVAITASNERRVVDSAVQPGQLLLEPMLETAAQVTGGIAIPPGMLAVTVQVCLPGAVAGYISAGSDVAVFDTYPVGGAKASSLDVQETCNLSHQAQTAGAVATRIVLPRVQVLSMSEGNGAGSTSGSSTFAAGSTSSADSDGSAAAVMVTFAVSQADAERLISLDQVGLPYLALLTPSSKTAFDTQPAPLFASP